jgi:hypothetical protein
MKMHTALFYSSILLLSLCQFYSCVKPPPNFEPGDASNVYNACRVKKISNSYQTRVFTYNSNNDPVSVINSRVGTGNPNFSFKYDNKNRLVQYGADYTSGFEILHRYGYSQHRITTDTIYALGNYNEAGEPVGYVAKRIAYLQYDKLNRVVTDSMAPTPYPNIIRYSYDQAGNFLIRMPDGVNFVQYDNKLNPHRTNKVWMFVARDYSVNNSLQATAYNAVGLPLNYNLEGKTYYGPFKFANMQIGPVADIEYDCK